MKSVINNFRSTTRKNRPVWWFVIFLLATFAACTDRSEKTNPDCEEILLNSFISSLRDSMMTAPHAVREIYEKTYKNTSDSLSSYKLLQQISQCYLWAGERENAIATLQKVIAFCEREEPTPCLLMLQADTYHKYGVCMSEIGEYDSTILYSKKTYDAIIQSENRQLLPSIYFMMADSYHRKGDYPGASLYYHRALFVTDSLNMGVHTRFKILETLANLYRDVDNFDLAENYYQQAEKHLDDMPDIYKNVFYNSRGVYYMHTKDYPKALIYHKLYFQTLFSPDPQFGLVSKNLSLCISV